MTSKFLRKERCPSCAIDGRDLSEDNLAVYDDHVYCFACGYYQSNRKFEHLSHTYEYLPWRGISKRTMEFYDVKTRIDAEGKPISILFPYKERKKVRSLEEKAFHWEPFAAEASKEGLFGQDLFTPGAHKYVTITEGETDALTLYELLGGPVVSVQSSTSAVRDCTSARSWLNSYERIYLAFDNDPNGKLATTEVAKLFDYDKVYHVKFTSRKDANEYLQAGEHQQLKNIWWNARKYLPENITSSLEDFRRELEQKPRWGVPYPFEKLTHMTYGIRTGEIVLVTAQEKVGKTEFMHAVLHSLLKETDDAVAGLFIEETKRRTLQALAGIHLRRPVHLPDCDIAQDQIAEAINQVVKRDDRLHLYSHTRSDDPEVVLDTIRFLTSGRSCKYVLFDHPGMAVFGLGDTNERLVLDTLATKLALMVKELDFALVVVSHVNDFGQTRGSRYLGKVCDLRIDLTRDTANADPLIRDRLNITIPYGRYCSNSGPVGSYLFNPDTQGYSEIEVANDNAPYGLALSKAA